MSQTTGVFAQDIPEFGLIRTGEVIPRDVLFELGRGPSSMGQKGRRAVSRRGIHSRDVESGQTENRPLVVAVTYRVGTVECWVTKTGKECFRTANKWNVCDATL